MAEIKLNEGFKDEVEAFRSSGESLSNSVVINTISAENLSLPTVDAYQERLFRIRNIMFLFSALVNKDAKDMDDLAARLKVADNTGG